MRKVLVIDDSVSGGAAMREARSRVEAAGIKADFIFAAVFGLLPQHEETDVVLEVVPHPRMFQWNFMHHKFLAQCCVDIDGVLCLDPTEAENDDGPAYEKFLSEALPLFGPTRKIGWLVTSRLEKYRALTEAWLAKHGIAYDRLIMLDLPSKAERQRLGVHGSFKADFYRKSDAILFIESEHQQALKIAKLSGKPVLCVETHLVTYPDTLSLPALGQTARNLPSRLRGSVRLTGARRQSRPWRAHCSANAATRRSRAGSKDLLESDSELRRPAAKAAVPPCRASRRRSRTDQPDRVPVARRMHVPPLKAAHIPGCRSTDA